MTKRLNNGVGIGLRPLHLEQILRDTPELGWLEILIDNFMAPNAAGLDALGTLRERYPLVFHGVGMNLGSADPLNRGYLLRLRQLIDEHRPELVSEHLAFCGCGGRFTPDLLPIPYTRSVQRHFADRVKEVQDTLGRRLCVENPSAYVLWDESDIPEPEFMAGICEMADCDLLIDVNNIYVTCTNFGLDPYAYLEGVAKERIRYLHMAGHEDWDFVLVDTHSRFIRDEVFQLYAAATTRFGELPTLLEWDRDIPSLGTILDVRQQIAGAQREALA